MPKRWVVELLFRLVGKISTVMEKLRAKTQYQLAIYDLGISGLVNPKIVNRLLRVLPTPTRLDRRRVRCADPAESYGFLSGLLAESYGRRSL